MVSVTHSKNLTTSWTLLATGDSDIEAVGYYVQDDNPIALYIGDSAPDADEENYVILSQGQSTGQMSLTNDFAIYARTLTGTATIRGYRLTPVAFEITGTPVEDGEVAVAYAGFDVNASGGIPPHTFSLVGDWPAGIAINANSGGVSGTPTEDGAFAGLSVRATDSDGNTVDLDSFTLTVAPEA